MGNGWIEKSKNPIAHEAGRVIVWHVYVGVLTMRREEAAENRFVTHWREIDSEAWIDARKRKPTREDADAGKCVISLDKWGGISTAGWHRFEHESTLTHWQHTPSPPGDIHELQIQTH